MVKIILALIVFVSVIASAASPPPPRDNKQELGSRPAIRVIGRITREGEGPNSRKAIRVIGRGGGLGEMLALRTLAQLKIYLTPCLIDPKLCGLSKDAHDYLLSLDARGELNTQKAILEFFTDPEENDFTRYNEAEPNRIGLSTGVIYDSSGAPKSFHEIMAAVFVAWTFRPSDSLTSVPSPTIYSEIKSAFEKISLEEQALSLGHNLTLRHMRINALGKIDTLLAIEGAEKTVDITPFINNELVLKTKFESANLTEIKSMYADGPYIVLRLRWLNDDQLFEGRVSLEILDPEKEISYTNLRMNDLMGVEELDCASKMTSRKK